MMAWAGYPSTGADSPERRTSPRPSPRHLGDGAVGVDGAGAGAVAGSPSPFPQLQRALARLASSVVSSSEAASELEPSPDRGIAVRGVGGEDQGEGDHELLGAESALLGMCGARRMGHVMLLRERPLLLPLPPPPPSLVCPLFCPLVCFLDCPLVFVCRCCAGPAGEDHSSVLQDLMACIARSGAGVDALDSWLLGRAEETAHSGAVQLEPYPPTAEVYHEGLVVDSDTEHTLYATGDHHSVSATTARPAAGHNDRGTLRPFCVQPTSLPFDIVPLLSSFTCPLFRAGGFVHG
jgi:hypothetical protein